MSTGGSTSAGKRPVGRDVVDESGDDEDGEGSGLLNPGQRRASRGWGFGTFGDRDEGQDKLGDWLRLKWWRKRWREDGEGDERDGRNERASEHGEGRA